MPRCNCTSRCACAVAEGTNVTITGDGSAAHPWVINASPHLVFGTGVPNNANGTNGDFYFRSDGGAGSCIYQKRGGVWIATAA